MGEYTDEKGDKSQSFDIEAIMQSHRACMPVSDRHTDMLESCHNFVLTYVPNRTVYE